MNVVGLLVNMQKEKVSGLVDEIVEWLGTRGIRVMMPVEVSRKLGRPEAGCSVQEMTKNAECILVLGGDGTILSSARMSAESGVPVLGINLGRLGFLSEIDIPDLIPGLEKLINGDIYVEERMLLQSAVIRNGREIEKSMGLNDAVITKGAFARLILLKTYIDGEHIGTYPADGLIVASPTGSTAYSLSAGGPVVTPEMELMLITPICPHSLWARPLVIPGDSTVEAELLSENAEVMLTMDGQHGFKLKKGDLVIIKKAPYRSKFIRFKNRSFFSVLHTKLSEGDRRNG